MRLSLAKWWKPEDSNVEARCYLQLSGWYEDQAEPAKKVVVKPFEKNNRLKKVMIFQSMKHPNQSSSQTTQAGLVTLPHYVMVIFMLMKCAVLEILGMQH